MSDHTDRDVVGLQTLEAGLRGLLLRPGDLAYNEARKVWNGMFDRRPALIVRCAGTADVIAAVNFARDHGLQVAVRGGGHSFPGHSVCDGGLVVDLSPMKGIRVERRDDPEIATPAAQAPEEVLVLRGAGGQEAAVGGDHVGELEPLDSGLRAGDAGRGIDHETQAFGLANRRHGLRHGLPARQRQRATPLLPRVHRDGPRRIDDVRRVPRDPPGGETVAALICCYCGPLAEGEAVVWPLRSFGPPPLQDLLGPMPYVAQQCLTDAALPAGAHYYTKGGFLRDLSDQAIDVFAEFVAAKPSPLSAVVVQTVCGAASRVDGQATAFAHRRSPYAPVIVSEWLDPADANPNVGWARDFWKALEPFAGGVYVNDLGRDDDNRVRAAYGANYDRLAELKKRYDPDNFFRLNPNIKPAR